MEYNKLVAVSGLPGLFELLSSKSDGAIVRSLDDKTTRFASSRIHQFSHLESIEIYTIRENVNLVDIFKAMEAADAALPTVKDDKTVVAYFKKVYPDMDFDRVYVSDMKKLVKWFDILKKEKIAIKLTEPEAAAVDTDDKVESEVEVQAEIKARDEKPIEDKPAAAKAKKEAPIIKEEKEEKKAPKKEKAHTTTAPGKAAVKKKKEE